MKTSLTKTRGRGWESHRPGQRQEAPPRADQPRADQPRADRPRAAHPAPGTGPARSRGRQDPGGTWRRRPGRRRGGPRRRRAPRRAAGAGHRASQPRRSRRPRRTRTTMYHLDQFAVFYERLAFVLFYKKTRSKGQSRPGTVAVGQVNVRGSGQVHKTTAALAATGAGNDPAGPPSCAGRLHAAHRDLHRRRRPQRRGRHGRAENDRLQRTVGRGCQGQLTHGCGLPEHGRRNCAVHAAVDHAATSTGRHRTGSAGPRAPGSPAPRHQSAATTPGSAGANRRTMR